MSDEKGSSAGTHTDSIKYQKALHEGADLAELENVQRKNKKERLKENK